MKQSEHQIQSALRENTLLTQSELKRELSYNPDTGLFTRLIAKPSLRVGDVAGYKEVKGYIALRINLKTYKAHRLAWLYMTGSMPINQIDHINGVRYDNRFCNLREATQEENLKNTKLRYDNKSSAKGIHFNKKSGKWVARGQINNKRHYLGNFAEFEQAKAAYDTFATNTHGDFYKDVS